MSLYIVSRVLVLNLTNLISHAFSKENMVYDPIECKSHYEVPNPGMFSANYERQGLRSGTFLSFYSLVLIFAFVGLTIVAFFCVNHWWQVIIAFIIANVASNLYSKRFPLRLHSVRYYITQVLTPLIIIVAYAVFFS